MLNSKPTTVEEAYTHGKQSHIEGLNPFRNMGVEAHLLNNAWYNGFESRQS
jgi:hypothetical protein